MSPEIATWINKYLDETITADEQQSLTEWLNAHPDHARRFAEAMMLHDRLHGELLGEKSLPREPAAVSVLCHVAPTESTARAALRRTWRARLFAAVGATVCAAVVAVVIWKGADEKPASAATLELRRIIAASAELIDRTYQIAMENEDPSIRTGTPLPPRGRPRPKSERERPPAPPMDGALLYVRGGRQFVLVRKGLTGRLFITGCNGETSWSVRPDGPVRVSSDLNRFRQGVPGQQHAVPLINIHEGLEGLLSAYSIELRETSAQDGDEPCKLLVAVKKSAAHVGPRRVEITYSVRTGRIQDMVFVDMPREQQLPVIIRLQLIEERDLGAGFFDHQAHHAADRDVQFEE